MSLGRQKSGAVFGGVCKGIFKDAFLARTLFVLSTILSGLPLLIYLILWISLPIKGKLKEYKQPKIMGLCLYLSKKYQQDLVLIRLIATTLLFLLGFIPTIIIYLILGLLVPKK